VPDTLVNPLIRMQKLYEHGETACAYEGLKVSTELTPESSLSLLRQFDISQLSCLATTIMRTTKLYSALLPLVKLDLSSKGAI
jgi:hypothetical protein